ncbi:hypothetical protein ACJMK2_011834 [Sinanodonta woodiana]|uniref:Carboxylic ester hydrolase n=1 Tax=Sinanodonta woodiana TaxID=1069815 RepID=A0ABD3V695_SINWO
MNITKRVFFIFCTLFIYCFDEIRSTSDPVVTTSCGPVAGLNDDGAFSFRGIPYALPPIGNLRWKPPTPLKKSQHTCWSGVYQAKTFGNTCFQRDPYNVSIYLGSEDCLYLNVYTPSINSSTKLPVMVWVHGGSLQMANANWPTYSPTSKLANETNIVYVGMNYRLHAFGFMALKTLADVSPTGTSGNYGLMDVILALKWVQENIQQFGGDPTNVTLFGQSSGGSIMFALLASPLCQGLFQKAWLLSPSPVLNKTAAEAFKDNEIFMKNTGCSDVNCLYSLTSEAVTKGVPWDVYPYWAMSDQLDLPTNGHFNGAIIIVDGVVLNQPPFDAWRMGTKVDVPCLIGTLVNEIDYDPGPVDLKEWDWNKYRVYVGSKLSTFGDHDVTSALSLYPTGVITPEYQFTSMVSDLRVNCPNDVMTSLARKYFRKPVYRYVATAWPSQPVHPINMPFAASYSFHMWDAFAFFGTIDQYINPMKESDIQWQNNVKKEVLSFVHSGHPATPIWNANVTAILSQNTNITNTFHPDQCSFWNEAGFFAYGWIN